MSFNPWTSNALVLLRTILFRKALRSPIAGLLLLSTGLRTFFLIKVAFLTPLAFLSILGFFLGGRMLNDGLVENVAIDAG